MNVATLKRSADDTHASSAKRHRGHLYENHGFVNKPHCGGQEPQGVDAVGCSHCGTVGQLSAVCVVVSLTPIGARWPLAVSLHESLYTLKSKIVSMACGVGGRQEQLVVSVHGSPLAPGLDGASLLHCGIGPNTELELDDREALLGRIHSLELELQLVRSHGQ